MFDKLNYIVGHTEFVPYDKTININSAPTDESIKLYDEMKEKAYESILDTIQVNNNILNISGVMYENYDSLNKICIWCCIINGKEITGKIVYGGSGTIVMSKKGLIKEIYKEVSEEITIQLLHQMDKNKEFSTCCK